MFADYAKNLHRKAFYCFREKILPTMRERFQLFILKKPYQFKLALKSSDFLACEWDGKPNYGSWYICVNVHRCVREKMYKFAKKM